MGCLLHRVRVIMSSSQYEGKPLRTSQKDFGHLDFRYYPWNTIQGCITVHSPCTRNSSRTVVVGGARDSTSSLKFEITFDRPAMPDDKPVWKEEKRRGVWWKCRCLDCQRGDEGFEWKRFGTIWRGYTGQPQRPSQKDFGHLQSCLNRFYAPKLKKGDKGDDGELIGKMLARKQKLLQGIQTCLQEQTGERDQWIKHVHVDIPAPVGGLLCVPQTDRPTEQGLAGSHVTAPRGDNGGHQGASPEHDPRVWCPPSQPPG